ncbi:unnamed protein product [Schistosoma margrebowiei]|uniref:Uncharacterized protein n=1 Tax=Schistosoma margrebowiei TaxID=48269 RepID=A0A183LIM9_9TREM|nr:unnamed protein product [Schistosoma margrebowiei]
MESRTHVLFYFVLISWMYLYLRVDVHFGTRTQYITVRFKYHHVIHLTTES